MALTEILTRRTREAKHYVRDDGTFLAEIGAELHYLDDAGNFSDIDLTFRPDAATGGSIADAHRLKTRVYRQAPSNWVETTERTGAGRGIRFRAPAQPTVGVRRASFANLGFNWDYVTTKGGLKLEATINASQGSRSYSFTYELLGGALPLQLDTVGNIVSPGLFTIPLPKAYTPGGRFLYRYGSWAISGNTITLTFDDTGLPTPYVLDPTTTFNVSASANDAFVYHTGTTWPPGGSNTWDNTNVSVVAEHQPGASVFLTEGLMKWDTSSIGAGMAVSAVTFRANCTSNNNGDGRNFTMDWGSWTGAAAGDWTNPPGTNAFAGANISTLTLNADNDVTLINVGNVNVSGMTYIRHFVSPSTTAPTNGNECYWAAWDHTTATEPRLLVTYAAIDPGPSAPTPQVAYRRASYAWR